MSALGSMHTLVRPSHEERVLGILRRLGALSRGEIADHVGLSRTTISEITGELLRRRAITVVDTDAASRSGSGRPAERLALDPGSSQYMGVDFGHRRVNVVVADAAHDVIASGSAPYAAGVSWSKRLRVAFGLVDRLGRDRQVHYTALQAIGIGLPGWGERAPAASVAREFAERYQAGVVTDNNVRYAGLAEAISSRSQASGSLLYLRLSEGVGGALIVGGQLLRGSNGYAAELGHATDVAGHQLCRCGKRGCLETVASVPAVLARCAELGSPVSDLLTLSKAMDGDDRAAQQAVTEAGAAVARLLATSAMILDPQEIVLGGDLVEAVPSLLGVAARAVSAEVEWLPGPGPLVRAAVLPDEGGAHGALAAVFHQSSLLTDYPLASAQSSAAIARRGSA